MNEFNRTQILVGCILIPILVVSISVLFLLTYPQLSDKYSIWRIFVGCITVIVTPVLGVLAFLALWKKVIDFFLETFRRTDDKNVPSALNPTIQDSVEADPETPVEEVSSLSSDELRRMQDVEQIKQVLYRLHTPTVDMFLASLHNSINYPIFWYFEQFNAIILSSKFYLHDVIMKEYFESLLETLDTFLTKYENFYFPLESSVRCSLATRYDDGSNTLTDEERTQMKDEIAQMKQQLREMIQYIKEEYFKEINLDYTNSIALENFKEGNQE